MMFDHGEDSQQNLLIRYTDALIQQGSVNLSQFLQDNDVELATPMGRLLQLADYLHRMLPQYEPSPEFVQALYDELVGVENVDDDWLSQFQFERQLERQLERWRHLPRHMQLAAGLTFTAGLFWIANRVRRDGVLSPEKDAESIERSA